MSAGGSAAAATVSPPEVDQTPHLSHRVIPSILSTLVPLCLGYIFGVTATPLFSSDSPSLPYENVTDPSYKPLPHAACNPPSYIRERSGIPPASPHCVTLEETTPTSLALTIPLPHHPPSPNASLEVSLSAFGRVHSAPRGVSATLPTLSTRAVSYTVQGLPPDADFVLSASLVEGGARRAFCRAPVSTAAAGGNLLANPGFEERGEAPFVATRFGAGEAAARRWTPFYNGGLRVVCGGVVFGGEVVQPRSGRCCGVFGGMGGVEGEGPKFYGAHQGVALGKGVGAFRVEAWYHVQEGTALEVDGSVGESPVDSLSLAVGWQYSDGGIVDPVFIDLGKAEEKRENGVGAWRRVCAIVSSPERGLRMAHVYFHFHDRKEGALLVDDVSVSAFRDGDAAANASGEIGSGGGCYTVEGPMGGTGDAAQDSERRMPDVHLRARVRPQPKQLTVAVPLTGDRVLRLEALSRLYGGGPIAAAVLVRDEAEANVFAHVWKRQPWLFNHVDVTLVYMSRARVKEELIPINALRNLAVKLATTDFAVMLDVDMTPATESFSCFRDPAGKFLEGLVPSDGSRIFTLPVFITDVHVRAASNKDQLLNQLHHRVATSYCLNSQRAVKIEKWYSAGEPYETRFTTDYEPYGICRRDMHPAYDERFVGYGFNKISWAWGAETAGARLFVMSGSFLTHLNHVDNDWVANINVSLYLRTWRRYFAYVAESASLQAPLQRQRVFLDSRAFAKSSKEEI